MRNLLLSIVSGVLFAASFPDIAIGWLMFVAFVPLLLAVSRAENGARAFLFGWASQTVAWLMMVPWVVRVMSHYGGLPYIVGVLIFVALAMILGCYGGLFAFIVHRVRPRTLAAWLLVPLAWAAVEYLRTYFLTGFPWNLIATAIVDYTSLIQIDRFAGPYFVGALMLIPAVVAVWLITTRTRGLQAGFAIAGTAIVVFVWWATGLVASKLVVRPTGAEPRVAALLQPNISQEMRWDADNLLLIFQRMIGMSESAIAAGAKVVIWPESTVPLSYSATDFYRDAIESLSARHGVDIILGSVAEDPEDPTKLWNAAFLVSSGKTVGHYDKIRLVPFGEYVPLRKLLFFADKLVRAVGDFQFGTNERPLRGLFAYGPAICYEVVFPQITRTQVKNGADVLVTITNDAWYDGTSAPRQHLDQARLRAIEGDRYVLRAATTGISALVDPTGRIIQELPMGRDGVIYARFQPRSGVTPYVRFGDWFAWVASGVTSGALWLRRKRNGNGEWSMLNGE
ncbi:MAG TPA: apolipoprotein N-acyltransferase [Thermoanaerobaculia bacterium]